MSKVKIQGNASGTGVVTLTAPNTNTDRTITLPDGTQTLIGTNASGNVGIGTSSPSAKLEVSGNGLTVTDSYYTTRIGYDIRNTTTGTYLNMYQDSGNQIYKLSGTSKSHIFMNAGGTEQARIHGDGGISFNGDTAAANALDDYETGTWSGVLKEGANTLVTLTGIYTKVGRLVTVIWRNNFTVSNNNNGLLTMGGLPYPVSYDALGSVQSRLASTTVGNFAVVAGIGSSTLSFRQGGGYTHNLPMNNLLATNGSSADYLYISCTYTT